MGSRYSHPPKYKYFPSAKLRMCSSADNALGPAQLIGRLNTVDEELKKTKTCIRNMTGNFVDKCHGNGAPSKIRCLEKNEVGLEDIS